MIQRYSFQIILVFIILAFSGLALIPFLSVQLNPSKTSGSIVVRFSLQNASPAIVEQQISSKIEATLSTLQGIKKISSHSNYQSGYVSLDLEKGVDIDQLRFEVSMLIRQIYPKLPPQASYPSVELNSPEADFKEEFLITLQLSGSSQATDLSRYAAESIKPKLASIKGIYEVNIYGSNQQEWVVEYNQETIETLGFKESDLQEAIKRNFKQESVGIITDSKGKTMNVVIKNQNNSAVSWHIAIGNHNGRIVYLTDLAKIYQQERPATQFYRINGKNALNISLVAEKGANQIKLSKQIRELLKKIKQQLPSRYQISIEQDATEYIVENLEKIAFQAGLAMIILLLFVWLSVRQWWYLALIVVSLLVNLVLSFIFFYIFKVEIHLYSLAALTTSLGIIIDNAIVMIDHYQRHRNLKVFMGLLGATLTTIAGLVVIFFLPEENRLDLTDFAMVMLITLLVSLPVALLFVPALMERFKNMSLHSKRYSIQSLRFKVRLSLLYLRFILFLKKYRKTVFIVAILAFGTPFYMIPEKIENDIYGKEIINKILGNEWYQENLKPVLSKYLGGTVRLFTQYVYESSYYQSPERTILYVNAGLPNNSTIEQMDAVFRKLENTINLYKEVDKCVTNIYDAQNGMMSIYFTDEAEKVGFAYRMKNILIQHSTEMSGIDWDIFGVGQGFSQTVNDTESPTFNIKMVGYNYDELERQAEKLRSVLEKHPRIQEVNINKSMNWYDSKKLYEYNLQTDDRQLAISGVFKSRLSQQLSEMSSEPQIDDYIFMDNFYSSVKIIPAISKDRDIWQLENAPLKQDSNFMSLKNSTIITKVKVLPEIIKENQQYLRRVSFTYFGSKVFGEKFLDKTLKNFNKNTPIGYKAENQEVNWLTEEKETKYWLIVLVMLLIYVICSIIFESFTQPLALVLLIPLSFIGVFFTFYCFDFNFDQGGYASFILLSGKVVCATIFIITEFNILKKYSLNQSDLRSYIKAFNHKLIPIFSTVLSTIVGLIPFLIFGEKEAFWFAFGVGTIGGLAFSLFIIPLFLPLFLKLENSP